MPKKAIKQKLLARISFDSAVMMGHPVIKGTRLTVQLILGLLARGMTTQEILKEYSELTENDILACLAYPVLTNRALVAIVKK